MPFSKSCRLALAAAALLALSAGARADSPIDSATVLGPTFSGSYLAGRSADMAHDLATAADFYRQAVAADPENRALAQRLLILSMATGNLADAFALAAKMAANDPANPAVRLALAVQNVAQNKTADALAELEQTGRADLAALTTSLAAAWIQFGDDKVDDALKRLAALKGPDWYPVFVDLHTALINDAAGRTDAAVAAAERAYHDDGSALRVVVAYARIMARAGNTTAAVAALTSLGGDHPAHPELRYLLADIRAGKKLAPMVADARAGFAETLYGLGSAIGTDQGPELPAAYLQLAAYLNPKSTLITMAIGDVLASASRCADAIALYNTVPQSDPLRRNADLQTGLCLDDLDRKSAATPYFKRVVAANPDDVEATIDLGNNYRAQNRFAQAAAVYSRAIKLTGASVAVPTNEALAATVKDIPKIETPPADDATGDEGVDGQGDSQSGDNQATDSGTDNPPADTANAPAAEPPSASQQAEAAPSASPPVAPASPQWRLFYYRGVSFQQSGRWPAAEADLKRALSLNPEQPSVLNYLGYSWVDRGDNLDLALKLIQKAVRLKPTDGYIVDSLGWAYFKLGRYQDAVETMEAAVQLSGGDATINDHLGDVYWTVGRKREALFQWTYARDSSPDKDLLPKILDKLKRGLPQQPVSGSDHTSVDKNQTMWDVTPKEFVERAALASRLTRNVPTGSVG